MDPILAAAIALSSAVVVQIVIHVLHQRVRTADREHESKQEALREARRVGPAFVDAVYSLRLRLNEYVAWQSGFVLGRSHEEVEELRDRKLAAIAEELNTDRATELQVRLWEVQVALGSLAAHTAEEIVRKLNAHFQSTKSLKASTLSNDFSGANEATEKCKALNDEIGALLQRFAEEFRAETTVEEAAQQDP